LKKNVMKFIKKNITSIHFIKEKKMK